MVQTVLAFVLSIYWWVLIARVVLSWVRVATPTWQPKGILLIMANIIYALTDPPLKFLQRFIKPVQIGNIAFDLAFAVLFVLVGLLQWLNVQFMPI